MTFQDGFPRRFSILKVSYLAQALLGRFAVNSSNVLLAIDHTPIFAVSCLCCYSGNENIVLELILCQWMILKIAQALRAACVCGGNCRISVVE